METMDYKDIWKNEETGDVWDAIAYHGFYLISLVTIIMLAEGMIQCGTEETLISAYQLVDYVPWAIFMPAAPFLNLLIYQERTSRRRKIIKFVAVTILFTVSLLVTMDEIMPQLTELYGAAELVSFGYPICFYINSAEALMGVIMGSFMESGGRAEAA